MEKIQNHPSTKLRSIDWVNTLFLTLTPVAAIIFILLHLKYEKWNPHYLWMLVIFYFLTGMSITAGYHRLFSHRTYQSNGWVKFLYLIFGASAFQNSALKWSTDHRRHHLEVDTPEDPYNINNGFFYAHIGWIFFKDASLQKQDWPKDLLQDKWVMWQHRNYLTISIIVGFIFPTLLGFILGSPLGALGILGFLKVVLVHHSTFFINSLCHIIGARPFTDSNTARDNAILAFFTFGEGFHNFHHMFSSDYRNGIRWYHYDPTKWLIQFLAKCKQAHNLHKVPEISILKAKLHMQEKHALNYVCAKKSPFHTQTLETMEKIKLRLVETQRQMAVLRNEYQELKRQKQIESMQKLYTLRANLKITQLEFKMLMRQWGVLRKYSALT